MTCIKIEHGFICGSFDKAKRLHVGNRYYWLEEHRYFGPSFWEDRLCSKELDLCYKGSERHPIWEVYYEFIEERGRKNLNKITKDTNGQSKTTKPGDNKDGD